jgi:hypothetical protein
MGYSAEAGLDRGTSRKNRGAAFRDLRLYKVSYHLNLLSGVSQERGSLIEALTVSHKLDIFETGPVRDLIDFRFDKFAKKVHAVGMIIHLIYFVILTCYIKASYLGDQFDQFKSQNLLIGIALCLIYPLYYDGT